MTRTHQQAEGDQEAISRDVTNLVDLPWIDGRVYTDQDIFNREMSLIFERCWVYVAHVSELAQPGDFRTVFVGRNPLIVVRGQDGVIRAFYNRCRHRGATVCQDPSGTTAQFQCIYHGWTFGNQGDLLAITDASGYPEGTDAADLGLTPVAALDESHGFVFVRLAAEGPSLAEHLGGMADYLYTFTAIAPERKIEVFEGMQRSRFAGNWKMALENGVDSYHPAYLHRSSLPREIRASYHLEQDMPGLVADVDGHGVLDMSDCPPVVPDGPLESPLYLAIFPNLILVRHQIRVIRPVSAGFTQIQTQAVRLVGLSDEENAARLRVHEFAFGPAGVIGADDHEVWERMQVGVESLGGGPSMVSRGLHREQVVDGHLTGKLTDETSIRAIYRSWTRWMTEPKQDVDRTLATETQDGK